MTYKEITEVLKHCMAGGACYKCPHDCHKKEITGVALDFINKQKAEIEKLQERNTFGEWRINCDGYYPYCSECGNEPARNKMTDYCSQCGAKMSYNDK